LPQRNEKKKKKKKKEKKKRALRGGGDRKLTLKRNGGVRPWSPKKKTVLKGAKKSGVLVWQKICRTLEAAQGITGKILVKKKKTPSTGSRGKYSQRKEATPRGEKKMSFRRASPHTSGERREDPWRERLWSGSARGDVWRPGAQEGAQDDNKGEREETNVTARGDKNCRIFRGKRKKVSHCHGKGTANCAERTKKRMPFPRGKFSASHTS